MNDSDCVKCQSLAYQWTVPFRKLMLTNDWEHKAFEHTINLWNVIVFVCVSQREILYICLCLCTCVRVCVCVSVYEMLLGAVCVCVWDAMNLHWPSLYFCHVISISFSSNAITYHSKNVRCWSSCVYANAQTVSRAHTYTQTQGYNRARRMLLYTEWCVKIRGVNCCTLSKDEGSNWLLN